MADEEKAKKPVGKVAKATGIFFQRLMKKPASGERGKSDTSRDQSPQTTAPASEAGFSSYVDTAPTTGHTGIAHQHIRALLAPEAVTDGGSNADVDGKFVSSLSPKTQSKSAFTATMSISNNDANPHSLQLSIPSNPRSVTAALWNTAYRRLQGEHSDLLNSYNDVIEGYLSRRDSEAESIEPSTLDRRRRLERVIEVWLRENNAITTENETLVGEARHCLRESLQLSAERPSYSALPWATICLFVETVSLQDSISEISGWGVVELIPKMEWYLGLSMLIFDRTMSSSENPNSDPMRERLLCLYEAILLYLIQQSVGSSSWVYWRDSTDYLTSTKQRLLTREKALVEALQCLEVHSLLQELFGSADNAPKELDSASEDSESIDEQWSILRSKLQPVEPPPIETIVGNRVLPQLYRWAMTTREYQRFFSQESDSSGGPGCRVLWVTGPPGAGKTMLMRATARGLFEEKETVPSSDKFHLAYFFCNSRDEQYSHVTQAIKSLIWQIIMSQPSLATYLEKKFQTTGREAFNDQSDFYALSTLLYEMIDDSNQDSSEFGLTYVVVDSIEELCINDDIKSNYHSGPSIDDLIQLIIKSTQLSTRIKWLVSAVQHHRSVALTEMDVATQETLRIDDHLDSHVRQNIITKEYVPLRVAEIAKETGFREPFQSQVNARFSNLVPSNFLWVDMACHHIKVHGLPWNATAVLDKLPRDLTGLYGETFQNIPSLGFKQDRDMCCDILFTTAITFRTLHKTEVESLLEMPPSVDLDILVKRMCSFFLEFYADNLCYVHSSAREFVREHLASHHDLSSKQLEMTTRCLRQAVAKNKPRSDTYAITNWVQHLMRVSREEHLSQAIEQVNVFFDDHFLEWAEVLTKRSLLLEAAVRLQRLSNFLKDMVTSSPTEQQVQCIQNTQQMLWLLNFRQTNSLDNLSPKYCLPFLPSDSKLRQGLLQKAFPWLAIAPHIDHSAAHIGAVHVLNDHGDWVRCCCYSPDGRLIASGGDDGVVRCWDAETFKVQHTFSVGSYVRRVLFSSDQLLLALSESTIKIWNSSTGQLVNDVQSSNDDFRDLHISPDGKEIVATRGATAVTLKRSSKATDNLDESDLVMDYDADCSIRAIRFSPDGTLIAYTQGWRVFLWDVEEKKTRQSFSEHDANIDGLAFSHDSRYLASASDDKTVRVWATNSEAKAESLCVLHGHEEYVNCVTFSPDGSRLASGSSDSTIRLWATKGPEGPSFEIERVLHGHNGSIYSVEFSPDGQQLVSSSTDWTARVWNIGIPDTANAKESSFQSGQKHHSTTIMVVCFSPGGEFFASASSDGKICLWDCADGNVLCSFEEHSRSLTSLYFSKDGNVLVSASRDSTICVWDTHRRELKHRLEGHEDWVRCAVVSPDGKFVASGSDDRSVRLWDISENRNDDGNRELRLFRGEQGHIDYVYAVAFSPNGRYLASGGDDLQVLIWDLKLDDQSADQPVTMTTTSGESIRGLTFTDDEARVVSWEVGGVVRIWNLETKICEQLLASDSQSPLFESILFDRNYLITEIGAWPISITEPLPSGLRYNTDPASRPTKSTLVRGKPPPWCRYGISNNRDWITWNNKELIFLPTQYRPTSSEMMACRVQGRMVVIGCESGQVLFFKFTEEGPYSQSRGESWRAGIDGKAHLVDQV